MDTELSLQHLQAELTRIDCLLQRAVRRWRLAGQDPADSFRGLYISDGEVDTLLQRPLHTNWGQGVVLPNEEAEAYAQTIKQIEQQIGTLVSQAHARGQRLRLVSLSEAFGLSRFDVDVLLIALAPALDLRYERLYSYLQDDVTRKRPTVNLALDLLCAPDASRLPFLAHFDEAAPLFRYRLVEKISEATPKMPLLSHSLVPDVAVAAWLLGHVQLHTDLGNYAQRTTPQASEADQLLTAIDLAPLSQKAKQKPIFVFYGSDHARQAAAVRLLVAAHGKSLLSVDLNAMVKDGKPPLQALSLALRDARLLDAWPLLSGWDVCVADDTTLAQALTMLCGHPDVAFVTSQMAWQARGVERARLFVWQEFAVPSYVHRQALWQHFISVTHQPSVPAADVEKIEALAAHELEALAGQFVLTATQIRDAVAMARDYMTQEGKALDSETLFAAARSQSSLGLMTLARKLNPRYSRSDIILPDDQLTILNEIVATVRERSKVLDEWGVGQKLASSRGVTVLFAGPPGTGKTMAAEVIASELGLDLYKIDLSTIISKYIGETEKNLERIFNEAESSNAILFFDEADAIFGKRSEVKDSHDRYANIEISYLLQRMEAYDGVTILATNLRANLDEAFTRRLQFAVDFPFPEEEDRLHIWESLFPPNVPRAANLDLHYMARRFKLAGGNIRNIIVNAAYLAAADGGVVKMEHLLHGTRRELQKMGRLLREKDMAMPREG